jgi:hypothetical protein
MPHEAEIAVVRGSAVVAARIARPVVSMFIAISGTESDAVAEPHYGGQAAVRQF